MYEYYLSRALVRHGHQVTVVASRWSPDVPALHHDQGVTIHRLLSQHRYWLHRIPGLGHYMRSIHQFLYSLRVARKLRELEAKSRPDVVEFAEVCAEGFVYLLPGRQRCPVVVRCHTPTSVLRQHYAPDEMAYDTSVSIAMENRSIRWADLLTAPSQDMAHTIARECRIPVQRVAVVPNALDVDLFSANNRGWRPVHREQRTARNITVLHVGRLERVKGIEVLAKAIPSVIAQVPGVRFVFIGPDRPNCSGRSWQEELKTYSTEQGLEVGSSVLFQGEVDQESLITWYAKSDIAVVPSLNYESFSYTCAQAMAAGLPVVASRIGGIPETVGDGIAGILVTPGDASALAQALVRLARDAGRRHQMGRAGQERAKRVFAADVVARRMLEVYRLISPN